jgi:hypothetical protein
MNGSESSHNSAQYSIDKHGTCERKIRLTAFIALYLLHFDMLSVRDNSALESILRDEDEAELGKS